MKKSAMVCKGGKVGGREGGRERKEGRERERLRKAREPHPLTVTLGKVR